MEDCWNIKEGAGKYLFLAVRAVKAGPAPDLLFLNFGGTVAACFSLSAVDPEIDLEISSFLAGVEEVTDG